MFGLGRRYRKWKAEAEQYDDNPHPGKTLTPFKSRIVRTFESIRPLVLPVLAVCIASPTAYYFGSWGNSPREIQIGITEEYYLNFDGIPDAIVRLNNGKQIPFYGANHKIGTINPKLKTLYLRNNPYIPESCFQHDDLVIRMLNGDRQASDELLKLVPLETRIEIFESYFARLTEIGEIKLAEHATRMVALYQDSLKRQQAKEQDKQDK